MYTDKDQFQDFTFWVSALCYVSAFQSVFIRAHPWLNCFFMTKDGIVRAVNGWEEDPLRASLRARLPSSRLAFAQRRRTIE